MIKGSAKMLAKTVTDMIRERREGTKGGEMACLVGPSESGLAKGPQPRGL